MFIKTAGIILFFIRTAIRTAINSCSYKKSIIPFSVNNGKGVIVRKTICFDKMIRKGLYKSYTTVFITFFQFINSTPYTIFNSTKLLLFYTKDSGLFQVVADRILQFLNLTKMIYGEH